MIFEDKLIIIYGTAVCKIQSILQSREILYKVLNYDHTKINTFLINEKLCLIPIYDEFVYEYNITNIAFKIIDYKVFGDKILLMYYILNTPSAEKIKNLAEYYGNHDFYMFKIYGGIIKAFL